MTKDTSATTPALKNDQPDRAIPPEYRSDEISLIDLILVLWRGKWIIGSVMVLVTIIGIIHALRAPEMFSTSTIFITKTGNKNTGNLGQLAALTGMNLGSGGNVDPSDYLDMVIEDKDFVASLFDRTWYFKGDSLPLETILKIEPDTTLPNWEYVYFMRKIEAVRRGNILLLKKDAKNNLLTLSTQAPDRQLAFDLNLFTLDFISSYIRNSIKSQAKEKRLFIEDRIRESKAELEKSEDALAKFKGSNLMTRSPQVILEEARLTRQVAMEQEVYIQFEKQYELARIEELNDQTMIQVVKGAEVPIIRSRPKRKQIVEISGVTGCFLGVIITLMYNFIMTMLFRRKNRL